MRPGAKDEFHSALLAWGEELRRFLHLRLPEGESADDLLQDVWFSFARTLEQTTVEQPRAWLYRSLRNRLTDEYRRRAGRATLFPGELPEPTVLPAADRGDQESLALEIGAALQLLPPAQREVFVRNEIEGDTLREIAAELGIPLKTAISRKGYAKRRLQELLRELYDEYFGPD